MHIRTSRLVIRTYQQTGCADRYEIFSDPEVMKYCEPVYTAERTKQILSHFIEKSVAFAVVSEDTGKVIGHSRFHQLSDEEESIYKFVNRDYWRQGYAYEASDTLIRYAFEEFGLHKIVAKTTDPIISVGLMKKLGMTHESTFRSHVKDPTGKWADLHWYSIINPKEE